MTEIVELVVRNIGGDGVIFTKDGKEVGHQVKHAGHYWYEGHGKDRKCYYRATFALDGMKDSGPE
jgi:hypothetical protein